MNQVKVVLLRSVALVAMTAVPQHAVAQENGGNDIVLDTVVIEGDGGGEGGSAGAKGAVDGLVADTSTAGSKSPLPIVETPQSVTVIGRDRIETLNLPSVNEALRYTPGVAPDVYGTDTRSDNYLTIRGLSANFLQDGLRLPSTRSYASWRVDPWFVERIELLRGPASILYGQGDPGGTINYVSKRPTDTRFATVEVQAGSNRRLETAFDAGGPLDPEGVWSYRIPIVASRTDLIGGNPLDGKRFAAAPSLSWKPQAGTSLTLFSTFLRDDTSIDANFLPARGTVLPNPNGRISEDLFTGDPAFDSYEKTQWSIGYEFEHALNETFTVRQNLRYADLDTSAETAYGFGLGSVETDPAQRLLNRIAFDVAVDARTFTVDNQGEARFDLGPGEHTMLVGLDYLHQRSGDDQDLGFQFPGLDLYNGASTPVDRSTLSEGQREDQKLSQVGLYIQDHVKLYDRFVVTGGLRYDMARSRYEDPIRPAKEAENDDDALSPRIGAVYLFDNGFAPYVSYSESFEQNVGTNDEGMPFDPSVGELREAGLRYRPPGTRHQLAASVFDIDQSNVVTRFGAINNFLVNDLNSRGAEFEALLEFDGGWRVIGSYTYQDVKITGSPDFPEEVGQRPTAVPDQIAQLYADYSFQSDALKGLRLGAGVRWNGSSYGGEDDDGNLVRDIEVPDFTLVDASVSYQRDDWRFSLSGTNLFDKKYVAACGDPTSCFYGSGRKVFAAARYTW